MNTTVSALRIVRLLAVMTPLSLGQWACGPSAPVTPQILRVASVTAAPTRQAPAPTTVNASSAVTVESFKMQLTEIRLNTKIQRDGWQTIYACDVGGSETCLVDLASGNALDNLLTGAKSRSIPVDTYVVSSFYLCNGKNGRSIAKVKAKGPIAADASGPTYYTQADSPALTTDPAKYGEATVYFQSCTRDNILPTPVRVEADKPTTLRLFFDIENAAYFGNASGASMDEQAAFASGGSTLDRSGNVSGTYLAVSYLDFAGSAVEDAPVIERYLLKTRRDPPPSRYYQTMGIVGLFVSKSGAVFGGYSRAYWGTASTTGGTPFGMALVDLKDNGDGTYGLSTIVDNNDGNGQSGFSITRFSRGVHAGKMTSPLDQREVSYAALPITGGVAPTDFLEVLYSDDFNRADAASLGGEWGAVDASAGETFAVVGQRARPSQASAAGSVGSSLVSAIDEPTVLVSVAVAIDGAPYTGNFGLTLGGQGNESVCGVVDGKLGVFATASTVSGYEVVAETPAPAMADGARYRLEARRSDGVLTCRLVNPAGVAAGVVANPAGLPDGELHYGLFGGKVGNNVLYFDDFELARF